MRNVADDGVLCMHVLNAGHPLDVCENVDGDVCTSDERLHATDGRCRRFRMKQKELSIMWSLMLCDKTV